MSIAEKILELRNAISALASSSGGGSSDYTDGLEYARFEEGYAVVDKGNVPDYNDIKIPPTHNGLPVVKIQYCAFAGNVIIPNSVRIISSNAFFGNDYKYIYIPSSVTTVEGPLQESGGWGNGTTSCFFVEWTSKPQGWADDWYMWNEPGEGTWSTEYITGCTTDIDIFEYNLLRRK